jgi:hypothetical protein
MELWYYSTTFRNQPLFPSSGEKQSTWAWSMEIMHGKLENQVFIIICVRVYEICASLKLGYVPQFYVCSYNRYL